MCFLGRKEGSWKFCHCFVILKPDVCLAVCLRARLRAHERVVRVRVCVCGRFREIPLLACLHVYIRVCFHVRVNVAQGNEALKLPVWGLLVWIYRAVISSAQRARARVWLYVCTSVYTLYVKNTFRSRLLIYQLIIEHKTLLTSVHTDDSRMAHNHIPAFRHKDYDQQVYKVKNVQHLFGKPNSHSY